MVSHIYTQFYNPSGQPTVDEYKFLSLVLDCRRARIFYVSWLVVYGDFIEFLSPYVLHGSFPKHMD